MTESSAAVRQARSDFWWLYHALALLLSALAIVALARHAITMGSLSAPLELVMAAYAATIQLLFGWAEPYLQAGLTWLGSFVGWRPTLYPHWRDVLVLMGLLPGAIVRGVRSSGQVIPKADLAFIKVMCVSIFVAALVVGTLPLKSDSLPIQILMACVPGAVLFLLVSRARNRFLVAFFLIIYCGVPAFLAWGLSAAFGAVSSILLVALAVAMILWGVIFIWRHFRDRADDDTFLVVGRTILGGFAGAAVFFAIDAGLKLLLG